VSFTKGRIIVRGKLVSRGQAKRADYVLYYKPNIPLAQLHSVGIFQHGYILWGYLSSTFGLNSWLP